jgi:hypothetical protein
MGERSTAEAERNHWDDGSKVVALELGKACVELLAHPPRALKERWERW